MSPMTSNTRGAARPFLFLAAALLLALLAALTRGRPALAAPANTFVVTNTGDAAGACGAACSLRQAIAAANANAGEDTITFNIPAADPNCSAANVCTITVGATLPSFTDSDRTTVDGSGAQIAVSGVGSFRQIDIAAGALVTLRELALIDGSSGAGNGGAIANGGTLDLVDSTVRFSNGALGGAVYNSGDLFVSGSTFESNKSAAAGGAIYNAFGLLSVSNSTFSSNVASTDGGAIYTDNAAVTHSTFYGNEAGDDGAAIFDTNGASTVSLANNLFAASPDGGNCAADAGGGFTDQGGNFSDDATCGTSGDNIDPLLEAALLDNGGPTLTHDLQPGSPALNTAVSAFCLPTDQRGLPRPLGSGCDSGAVENTTQLGPDYVVNSTLDTDDGACTFLGDGGDCTLREAVALAQAGAGDNRITFDIPAADAGCAAANVCTILLGAALPDFDDTTGATTIDGESGDITISGANAVPFGSVQPGAELALRYLTVVDMFRASAGGVLRSDGTLTLERSTFFSNEATGNGSVIYNEGTLVVQDSVFNGNTAGSAGALLSTNRLIVRGSTFTANNAASGAAISSFNGDLTVENSTFSGNLGASALFSGGGFIRSSTFYNNNGTDVIDSGLAVAPLALTNVLLDGGAGPNCGTAGIGAILDGGGNISDDATCLFTAVSSQNSTNPLLVAALADNGGPTPTHALQPASPAIDTAVSACPATDQRGVSRAIIAGCDRGAYESGAILVNASEDSSDGSCDPLATGDCTLREAIIVANGSPGPNDIFFYIPAADPGCSATNLCTIALASALPNVNDATATVSINGPGAVMNGPGAAITVSGQDSVRPLAVSVGASLLVRDLTLERGSGGAGGAIASQGTLEIERVTLRDNGASGNGGAIVSSAGDLFVSDSTFSGNAAVVGGGAIAYVTSGVFKVTNSTFSANTADLGGAVYAFSGSITNSTFYDNSATTGGAVVDQFAADSLALGNNLLVAGATGDNCDTLNGGAISDGGGNFSDDASCGTTGDNATILLDPALANSGGPTQTHALLAGSDGVDAAVIANCPYADQRGAPRPLGDNCDSGAFEITYTAVVRGEVTLQGRAAPGTPGSVTFTYDGAVYPDVEVPFDLADGSYSAPLPVLPGGSDISATASHDLYLDNTRAAAPFNPGSVALPATGLKGGDANNSGVINIQDLGCMGAAYNTPGSSCGGTGGTDINQDGVTNIGDLAIAGGNYNLTSPQTW